METILTSIEESGLHDLIRGTTWIWPVMEVLHFIGLSLLVAGVALIDLRLMGVRRILPVAAIPPFIRLAVLGFGINLATGVLFFVGDPMRYFPNPAFRWKMAFILLAGINLVVFAARVRPVMAHWNNDSPAALTAKIVALLSILLWIGVITGGRLIPFYDLSPLPPGAM